MGDFINSNLKAAGFVRAAFFKKEGYLFVPQFSHFQIFLSLNITRKNVMVSRHHLHQYHLFSFLLSTLSSISFSWVIDTSFVKSVLNNHNIFSIICKKINQIGFAVAGPANQELLSRLQGRYYKKPLFQILFLPMPYLLVFYRFLL